MPWRRLQHVAAGSSPFVIGVAKIAPVSYQPCTRFWRRDPRIDAWLSTLQVSAPPSSAVSLNCQPVFTVVSVSKPHFAPTFLQISDWHRCCRELAGPRRATVRIDVLDHPGENPMCAGDDRNCPEFELHRRKLLDELDAERRSFLKSALAATGGAAALTAGSASLVEPAAAQTVTARQGKHNHHYVPPSAAT